MKPIKFNVLSLALGSVLCIGAAPVNAAGILTMDVATIAQLASNAIEQAKQAKEALDTAKEEIAQARSQYEEHRSFIKGNELLGNLLHDPELQKILPLKDWADIYDSVEEIKAMRERYKLKSDDEKVQARFDEMLAVAGVLEQVYEASTKRVENAEALREKLNEVETPQQKEDLQLRYQHEFLELQVQQQRLGQMQMLVKQNETIENQRRIQSFKDYAKGNSSTIPQY